MTLKLKTTIALALAALLMGADDCDGANAQIRAASGVHKADVEVRAGSDGYTVEQRNIRDRLHVDNLPGSIKHLYVISAYSGQVIIYSTVRGKVTSGSKRLTPSTVAVQRGTSADGIPIYLGTDTQYTGEVLGDDGAYGSSGDYIYWFDSKGAYHQHYNAGGQIVHISDQPLAVKSIIINTEAVRDDAAPPQ